MVEFGICLKNYSGPAIQGTMTDEEMSRLQTEFKNLLDGIADVDYICSTYEYTSSSGTPRKLLLNLDDVYAIF